MLGETDLVSFDTELDTFEATSRATYEKLQTLLQRHKVLLRDYRQLRSDYEEEKESREKYKKLARAQERDPFVLVLIDGDGYVFRDELLTAGANGGIEAAQMLNTQVQECLPRLGLENCRIMVRVYCNLAGLSKTLARAKLVGFEARSLAPFTASFTRAQDLYDFVDAGDKKEGADFKIREMFRLFAENSQCKHIFFGGCHDTGYLSLLTPYRGKVDRITLLKSSSYHSEFQSLNLGVEDVSSLFRIISLDDYAARAPMKSGAAKTAAPVISSKYGDTFPNGPVSPDSPKTPHTAWRLPVLPYNGDDNHHDSINGNASPKLSLASVAITEVQQNIPESLPRWSQDNKGKIPLSRTGQRLDYYLEKPSKEQFKAFTERARQTKPCNELHLGGSCANRDTCTYDHNPLTDDQHHVLRVLNLSLPCVKGSKCRSALCYRGHLCQKSGCRGAKCRFNGILHCVDPHCDKFVEPE